MPNRKSDLVPKVLLSGDLILLNISFFAINISFFTVNYTHSSNFFNDLNDHYIIRLMSYNFLWIVASSILNSYGYNRVVRISEVINTLLKVGLLHVFFIFSFMVLFKQEPDSIKHFIFKYSLFFICLIIWRLSFVFFLKHIRTQGYNYKLIVIAGGERAGKEMNNFFNLHPEYGYKCLGFFDDNENYKNRIGKFDELESFVLKNNVDEIYCSLSYQDQNRTQKLISFADNNLIKLKILPDFRSIGKQKVEIYFYDNIPVLNLRSFPLEDIMNKIIKRTFDIFFSTIVILLIFPWLFPIISIFIKFSSKGPVFFKQLRSGKNNKPFLCYKFRSMAINLEANTLQATKNDLRITKVGKFLRRSSLDELPQFFNVLIGNMSVVGPRPHMLSHTEKYSKEIDKFMFRHFVKAGITGLAQIKGFRGETSQPSKMIGRLRYDIYYIENWTFYFDIKIIFLTIIQIFRGKISGD